MLHQYGQTYEVTDLADDKEATDILIGVGKEVAQRHMEEWIAENHGKVVTKKVIVSEPIWRDYYHEYDEDGEGIGRPYDGRWVTVVGWKVTIEQED